MDAVHTIRELTSPDRVATLVRDTVYVGIGFAVLGFQRVQVLRRELERAIPGRGH